MTRKNQKLILFACVCLAAFSMVVYSSCSKKSSGGNDAAKFVGTWTGTSTCGGAVSLVLNAGSNGSTLASPGDVGSGSCFKAVSLTLTASGNTLTMPSQTFSDNCGATYTTSGSGTLSGNTLTFTQSIASSLITATCQITATK